MSAIELPRRVSANGIAWHRAGDTARGRAPLLLIHGVGLVAESWFEQIATLSARRPVYAIDLPGHGQSTRLTGSAPSLAQFSERIGVFVADVIGEPAILVGHSLGGLVALDLAERDAQLCRAVAALNSIYRRSAQAGAAVRERARALSRDDGDVDLRELATAPLLRWFGDHPYGHERELANLCRTWLRGNDRQGYAAAYTVFAHEDGADDAALARLHCPALFVTGDADANSTPAMAQAMAKLAPHGDVHIIDGARHLAQLTHAAQTNAILDAWCTRCDTFTGDATRDAVSTLSTEPSAP